MSENYMNINSLCERITAPLNEIIKATAINVNTTISEPIIERLSNSLQKKLSQISDNINANINIALQPLIEYCNNYIKELADIQKQNLSVLCKSLAESIDNSNVEQELAAFYDSIPENVTFEFNDDDVEILSHIDYNLRVSKKTTFDKNTIISVIALLIAAATLYWTIKASIESGNQTDEIIANQQETNDKLSHTNELLESIFYQLDQASSESD